jgi:phospholipid transport system substrate-binding protein
MAGRTRAVLTPIVVGLAACLLAVVTTPGRAAGPEDAAGAFVERFIADAQAIVVAPDRTEAERDAGLEALLLATIELETVGRLVLGREWQTASEAELAAYKAAFERTLVRRLNAYRGEAIKILDVRALPDGDLIVSSRIRRSHSAVVTLDWRLRPVGGGFKMFDVVVEGFSLVVTHRNEFASVIRNLGGLSGLTALLKERAAAL